MKNEILLTMLSVCAILCSGPGLGEIAGTQLKGVRRIVFISPMRKALEKEGVDLKRKKEALTANPF